MILVCASHPCPSINIKARLHTHPESPQTRQQLTYTEPEEDKRPSMCPELPSLRSHLTTLEVRGVLSAGETKKFISWQIPPYWIFVPAPAASHGAPLLLPGAGLETDEEPIQRSVPQTERHVPSSERLISRWKWNKYRNELYTRRKYTPWPGFTDNVRLKCPLKAKPNDFIAPSWQAAVTTKPRPPHYSSPHVGGANEPNNPLIPTVACFCFLRFDHLYHQKHLLYN